MSAFGQGRQSGVGIPGKWGTDTSNTALHDTIRIVGADNEVFVHNVNRVVTSIVVSVVEGEIDIWHGNLGRVTDPADYHFEAIGRPVEVPVRSGNGRFTIRTRNALGGEVLAAVHFEGP